MISNMQFSCHNSNDIAASMFCKRFTWQASSPTAAK